MNFLNSLLLAGFFTFVLLVIFNFKSIVILIKRSLYPKLGDTYHCASQKSLKIGNYLLQRNREVKFYVPHADQYVEGLFIGVDESDLLYVLENMEKITIYSSEALKAEHIVYVKN